MRSGWWIGVTAGVALGLGTVATVDVATQPASAATAGTVTIAQFKQVQKVSVAADAGCVATLTPATAPRPSATPAVTPIHQPDRMLDPLAG